MKIILVIVVPYIFFSIISASHSAEKDLDDVFISPSITVKEVCSDIPIACEEHPVFLRNSLKENWQIHSKTRNAIGAWVAKLNTPISSLPESKRKTWSRYREDMHLLCLNSIFSDDLPFDVSLNKERLGDLFFGLSKIDLFKDIYGDEAINSPEERHLAALVYFLVPEAILGIKDPPIPIVLCTNHPAVVDLAKEITAPSDTYIQELIECYIASAHVDVKKTLDIDISTLFPDEVQQIGNAGDKPASILNVRRWGPVVALLPVVAGLIILKTFRPH